ncbi:hypothetical protein PPL_02494 [Heterostelium album PN500]|uniref:Ubiquitin-like domain-containing protein n=1 Tax=Heterostelium pallidum (strain ATCC 26659 / Pp 5 / PN500) TaxID=670386 RepID=D3B286_HETP5|nr:hypothetical protein PPL_02494 [Heterostelium album PN500]EFA84461.1 hypothetical protein PPL_02494 [Heterostelium album PN500]|eukprot:XP_020436575.1 hypothetical protein PPL_02494 [Heterostelium album PN500]
MFNLKILRSDTGSLYEIPVNSSVTINTIKESLASVTNLSPSDQILLADTNLSSNNTLQYYGIIKDTEIFLFNKKILENMSYLPEEVNFSILDFQIPRLPTPKNLKELESSLNPLNKMFTLEFYLNNHVVGTQYLKELFEAKVLQCINCLNELNVQKKSIGAALHSLDDYKNKLLSNYNSFLTVFKKQSPNFESLLMSFEYDMNRLKQTKLHDSLRTPSTTTLLDCIPELEIRKWSEQCKREYDNLKGKILEIGSQIDSIRDSVDYELKKTIDINFQELNDRLIISRENTKQFQTLYQASIANSEKIKKALESSRSSKDPNHLAAIIMSFTEIKNSQDSSFSDSHKHAELLMNTLILFSKAKNFMNQYVFSELRNISKLQYDMRQLINNFSVWNEAISKQTINFFHLECIHHMPSAYEDALNETSRRKKFGNSIQSNLGKFIESLNGIREEENQKRQMFFERVYQFLPPNVFISLKDQLPPFQVHLPAFDTNLPQIEQQSKSDTDDDFAVIDSSDTTPLQFRKKPTFERTSSSSQLDQSKLIESQQKDKIRNLEQKLQSTFLMASRSEEKYKDLLEKSRTFQNDSVTSDYIRKSQVEELKKELEEKKLEISKLLSEGKTTQKNIETLQAHESELSLKIRDLELENTYKKKEIESFKERILSLEDEGSSKLEASESLRKQLDSIKSERDELQAEIKDLQEQITRHEEYIKMSISSTNESKESFENTVLEKNNTIAQLEKSKKNMEIDLQTANMKISIHSDRIAVLEKEKSELEEERNTLVEKWEDQQEKIKLLEEKISNVESISVEKSREDQEEINRLKDKILVHEGTVKSNNKQISDMNGEIQSLQSIITENQQEIDKLRETIDHNSLMIEQLKEDNEKLSKDLVNSNHNSDSNEAVLAILREQINDLKNEAQQKEAVIKSSSDQLRDNESTMFDLENSIKNYKKLLDEFNDDKEKQSGETNSMLQSKAETIIKLESQINQLDKQIRDQDATIEQLQSGNSGLTQLNSQLEQKIQERIAQIEEFKQMLTEKDESLRTNKKESDYLSRQTSELENKVISLNQQLEQTKTRVDTLEAQNVSLESDLDSSQKEQIALAEKLNQVSAASEIETENFTLSLANLEKKLKEKESQLERASNGSDELTRKYNKLQISSSETNEEMLSQITSYQNEISKAESEIEAYKQTIAKHEERISYLKDQCDTTNVNSIQQVEKLNKEISEKDTLLTTLKQRHQKNESQLSSLNGELQASSTLIQKIYELLGIAPNMDSQNALKEIKHFRENFLHLERSVQDHQKTIQTHEHSMMDLLMSQTSQSDAALSNFGYGKIAIFQYLKSDVYEAVNVNCPHHYLSPESLESFDDEVRAKKPIIASIIEVTKVDSLPNNRYGLPNGYVYYEVLAGRVDS